MALALYSKALEAIIFDELPACSPYLRTLAAQQLQQFVQELGVPCLGMLRSTQNYVTLAANGLTLFDLPPARAERDLAQWQELTAWLDR